MINFLNLFVHVLVPPFETQARLQGGSELGGGLKKQVKLVALPRNQ